MVCQTEMGVTVDARKCLPSKALIASEIDWRRGDSNPIQPVSCPAQNRDNSTTNRDAEAEKRGLGEQTRTLATQEEDIFEHRKGAPAVHLISGVDPDLMLIQDRWPRLPEHVRQAVLTLVRSVPYGG